MEQEGLIRQDVFTIVVQEAEQEKRKEYFFDSYDKWHQVRDLMGPKHNPSNFKKVFSNVVKRQEERIAELEATN
ncbi:MAG: hypothetical protein HYX20_00670 [Candidatus Yanofskybacteria bacterium]|nr:hypothetical protein [Candidatus Yanofskybacteria bacterium]